MMATAPPSGAQLDLINSLSQDDIPIKLRCAICSKLAVNAFRLPCCEQAICETCQSTLPSSCPVCEHNPVAAEDCKPNKSLRTTIKVFLRTEEKKREALRLKEVKNTPPFTPSTPIEAPIASNVLPEVTPAVTPEYKAEISEPSTYGILAAAAEEPRILDVANNIDVLLEDQQDVPQPSIEEIVPGQEETEEGVGNNEIVQSVQADSMENFENGQSNATNNMPQSTGFGMGFGFDAAGGFPNMGMMAQGGDFNQMQMMMAMQNGLATNAFGNFPMMGMQGMTMDPLAMQNMFMNGGFGTQGMGMNMGMGMAGFNGGIGAGFNNGWNGQQSWNIGQDNFNHPNASGIGHGDYGANNSGFHAGYNQGNYVRSNQYNDNQQNGYGQGQYSRGRGRGRGYIFGQHRGGHDYGQPEAYSQQNPQQYQNGSAQSNSGSIPTGPKAVVTSSAPLDGNVDEYGRELREKTEMKHPDADEAFEPTFNSEDRITFQDGEAADEKKTVSQKDTQSFPGNGNDDTPKPIQTLEQMEHPSYASNHNDYGSMQPPNAPLAAKAPDVPLNAPTGPKAMLAGLPNTSILHIRARGLSIPEVNGQKRQESNTETIANSVRSPSETSEKERDRDESRSRSRSRSQTDGHRHKRRQRHRSTSLSEDGKEEERRRERRRRHSRKYDDKDGDHVEGDVKDRANGGEPDRSRSHSPSESQRSSHRSRRDRDYDREIDRDRERDKDHKSSSYKHRSSHRSHRDRSRDRERDRSREHRHRRRHESDKEKDPDTIQQSAASGKPDSVVIPTGPRSMTLSNAFSATPVSNNGKLNGIEINIRGSSHRKSTQVDVSEPPPAAATTSRIDEHKDRDREREREREKEKERGKERNRERERSSRHREERDRHSSSRSERRNDTNVNVNVKIPTGPAASKAAVKQSADPHTLEREARNRERLMKEAQRMAGLSALMGGTTARKRSLPVDDGGDDSGKRRSRKSRTKSERWEDEGDAEAEEARLARLEREREGGR